MSNNETFSSSGPARNETPDTEPDPKFTQTMNPPESTKRSPSLSALHEVELAPPFRSIYETVAPGAAGPEPWRRRKLKAAHAVLAAAQVSRRMIIRYLDLTQAIRMVFELKVPVPCRRDGTGPFQVAPKALVALTYRQEAVLAEQPGHSFAEILEPRHVFHPNIWPSYQAPGAQQICLGPRLPRSIPIVELILMIYTATCFQSVTYAVSDPAGLLNPAAGAWLQANSTKIPLTREPFLNKEAHE